MQSFTVHTPNDLALRAGGAENAVFVPDGFSFGAFVFGGFWLVYHRLWIVLAGYLAVLGLTFALGYYSGIFPMALTGISLLTSLFLGFEGSQFRRWTLERNGMPAVAVVTGRKESDAEAVFFARIEPPFRDTRLAPTASGASLPPLPAQRGTEAVLGVFPQPGGRI